MLVLLTLSGFLLFYLIGSDGINSKNEYAQISIISRSQSSSSFEALMLGAEQAAADLRAEITFITLAENNSYEEQEELLYRELNNGAKAILLMAADYEALAPAVDEVSQSIPVVAIESPVNSSGITSYISADNAQMGLMLGNYIKTYVPSGGSLVILGGENGCQSLTERANGLSLSLENSGRTIIQCPFSIDADERAAAMGDILSRHQPDAIVALDSITLESAASAVSILGDDTRLFGMGVTGRVASNIEKGIITAAVAQNGYNIGYLGVRDAVHAINKNPIDESYAIEFRVINSVNLYTKENQRMLFPFVR